MTAEDAHSTDPSDRIDTTAPSDRIDTTARLTAAELLASPRGRSLVFGLALRGREDEFDEEAEPLTVQARALDEARDAVFIAGFLAGKAQGSAVAMYLGDGDVEPAPGTVTAAEVADRLRVITPLTPTQTDLEEAMADVIGDAMYWQPPHGADQIAADPEVCEALSPFAEALVSTGLLDTWVLPLDPENQWSLAWDDEELEAANGRHAALPAVFDRPPGPVASDSPAVGLADLWPPFDGDGVRMPWGLDEWLADILTTETRYRHDFAKNPYDATCGGWWSTPPIGLWTSTGTWPDGTPIGVELIEDDFGLERARACRLRLRPDARIAEIRTPGNWAELCRRYPLDVTAQRRQVWFETTGRRGRWVIPDWSRVAEDFDGVHVGLAGYLRTAGAVIDVGPRFPGEGQGYLGEGSESMPTAGNMDERTASLMAGWHPDTTFWLNDVVDTVTEVADWRSDDDGRWVRD